VLTIVIDVKVVTVGEFRNVMLIKKWNVIKVQREPNVNRLPDFFVNCAGNFGIFHNRMTSLGESECHCSSRGHGKQITKWVIFLKF
jgi:hypothetical protein